MDRNLKYLVPVALLALTALTGCRHVEQELSNPAEKTVLFHAGTAETRTAFAEAVDGVYQTLWTENDSEVLLSLNYGKAEASAITPSSDGKTATFAATFDASSATSPYTFYAVSPASAARAISPSRQAWSVYIASEQSPSALSVDEGAQLLVAKSASSATLPDEVDLHFAHLTAYGRIALKNLELGEAVVEKADLVFSVPVVGEWYWGEDGTLTSNGASHTITLETDASGDLWFACAPVDVSGATMSLVLFTDQGTLTKEITFPEGRKFTSGKVARFSVDMSGLALEQREVFLPVTDAATLEAGDKVLIVNAEGSYALGPQVNRGTAFRERAAVTLEDGRIVDPGEATVLTLSAGSTSGTWSFHTGSGYLSAATSQNSLKESSMKNAYSSWEVTISDGAATIQARKGSSTYIRYDAQGALFSCYPSSSVLQGIALYRWGREPVLTVEDPLADFHEIGSYLSGAGRTYVRGTDQISRCYDGDGKLVFALLNASIREKLVVSGYDPSRVKGEEVTVTVWYQRGDEILLENQEYTLRVVREDGSRVWLGNGTGEGLILKK